jgi:hypothetical protein
MLLAAMFCHSWYYTYSFFELLPEAAVFFYIGRCMHGASNRAQMMGSYITNVER